MSKIPTKPFEKSVAHPAGVITHSQMSHQFSIGPFPLSSELRAYEEILPGAADRLLQYTERNQSHRHSIELKKAEDDSKRQSIGQWMAFTIAFMILIAAFVLLYVGRSLESFTLIITEVAGIAGLFFMSERKKSDPQNEQKK